MNALGPYQQLHMAKQVCLSRLTHTQMPSMMLTALTGGSVSLLFTLKVHPFTLNAISVSADDQQILSAQFLTPSYLVEVNLVHHHSMSLAPSLV